MSYARHVQAQRAWKQTHGSGSTHEQRTFAHHASQADSERSEKAFEPDANTVPFIASRIWVDQHFIRTTVASISSKPYFARVPFFCRWVGGHGRPILFGEIKLYFPNLKSNHSSNE